MALSVNIELVSSSARVTSVKFQKGVSVSQFERPIDRTPGTPGSDKQRYKKQTTSSLNEQKRTFVILTPQKDFWHHVVVDVSHGAKMKKKKREQEKWKKTIIDKFPSAASASLPSVFIDVGPDDDEDAEDGDEEEEADKAARKADKALREAALDEQLVILHETVSAMTQFDCQGITAVKVENDKLKMELEAERKQREKEREEVEATHRRELAKEREQRAEVEAELRKELTTERARLQTKEEELKRREEKLNRKTRRQERKRRTRKSTTKSVASQSSRSENSSSSAKEELEKVRKCFR